MKTKYVRVLSSKPSDIFEFRMMDKEKADELNNIFREWVIDYRWITEDRFEEIQKKLKT